jgi:hypothetical protein
MEKIIEKSAKLHKLWKNEDKKDISAQCEALRNELYLLWEKERAERNEEIKDKIGNYFFWDVKHFF